MAQYQTEVDIQRESNTKFHVPTVDIASALQQFQSTIRSQAVKLGQALNLSSRRSPRRRSLSEDTDINRFVTALCIGTPPWSNIRSKLDICQAEEAIDIGRFKHQLWKSNSQPTSQ